MSTKEERDLEAELGPSPWPMFEDAEEPWTDPERMLKLREKFTYQYEIAHVLGTTPSTVSYWMDKAEAYERSEALKSGALCAICEENETPGGAETGNSLCEECTDAGRTRRRKESTLAR